MQAYMHAQKPSPESKPIRTVRDSIPAIERVEVFVEALNIVRKNARAYPSGHIQLAKSIRQALDRLNQVFEVTPELRLDVKKNCLHVNADTLVSKRPAITEFIQSIHRVGISALIFYPGLNQTDIEAFVNVIKWDPKDIWTAGGIGKITADKQWQHIKIEEIDYRTLELSEGAAVAAESKADDELLLGLWTRFVKSLTKGDLSTSEKNCLRTGQGGARQIAQLLNENKLDSKQALKSFHHLLTRQAAESLKRGVPVSPDPSLRGHLNDLLMNLQPELRQQFLSVTFRNLSHREATTAVEAILGNLSDELVIEMLRIANKKNKQISPALIRLIQRMSGTRSLADDAESKENHAPTLLEGFPNISIEQMKHLFERERYEYYVDADYDSLLGRVAAATVNKAERIKDFDLDQQLQTLSDDSLDARIDRLLFLLLDSNIDSESYRTFADKLLMSLPSLLKDGRFNDLLNLFKALNRHRNEKKDAVICRQITGTLKAIASPQFLQEIEQACQKWSADPEEALAEVYFALGPACIPALLSLYGQNEYSAKRKSIRLILKRFGQPALAAACRQLDEPNPESVLNIIGLIKKIGGPPSVQYFEPLLEHRDTKVRFAALDLLLAHKSSAGVVALHRSLYSAESQEVFTALFLTGKYRVKESCPILIRMINTRPLSKVDIDLNESIVRSLGKIGDAAAIPVLEKLARLKWSLHPGRFLRMKTVIFESLANYPHQSIEALIRYGLKSKNSAIREACHFLAGRQGDK